MSDFIKREDALAVIYGQHICGKEGCENARPNTFGADLREIAYDIEDIPAADVVERKVGHWDDGVSFYLRCSECGCCLKQPSEYNDVFLDIGRANYCPNCGAEMDWSTSDV